MPTRYSKQTAKTGAAIGTVIAAPKPGNYTGRQISRTQVSSFN